MSQQHQTQPLLEAILALPGAILAVGDIMLDTFTYSECAATRIMPASFRRRTTPGFQVN